MYHLHDFYQTYHTYDDFHYLQNYNYVIITPLIFLGDMEILLDRYTKERDAKLKRYLTAEQETKEMRNQIEFNIEKRNGLCIRYLMILPKQ